MTQKPHCLIKHERSFCQHLTARRLFSKGNESLTSRCDGTHRWRLPERVTHKHWPPARAGAHRRSRPDPRRAHSFSRWAHTERRAVSGRCVRHRALPQSAPSCKAADPAADMGHPGVTQPTKNTLETQTLPGGLGSFLRSQTCCVPLQRSQTLVRAGAQSFPCKKGSTQACRP